MVVVRLPNARPAGHRAAVHRALLATDPGGARAEGGARAPAGRRARLRGAAPTGNSLLTATLYIHRVYSDGSMDIYISSGTLEDRSPACASWFLKPKCRLHLRRCR